MFQVSSLTLLLVSAKIVARGAVVVLALLPATLAEMILLRYQILYNQPLSAQKIVHLSGHLKVLDSSMISVLEHAKYVLLVARSAQILIHVMSADHFL